MSRYVEVLRGVVAFGLIVSGIAFWSIPAALVTAGVLLIVDMLT